jgi:hypothetical protein
MKKRFMVYLALLVPALLFSGCSFFIFDDSDEIVTVDKTVSRDGHDSYSPPRDGKEPLRRTRI